MQKTKHIFDHQPARENFSRKNGKANSYLDSQKQKKKAKHLSILQQHQIIYLLSIIIIILTTGAVRLLDVNRQRGLVWWPREDHVPLLAYFPFQSTSFHHKMKDNGIFSLFCHHCPHHFHHHQKMKEHIHPFKKINGCYWTCSAN